MWAVQVGHEEERVLDNFCNKAKLLVNVNYQLLKTEKVKTASKPTA